MERTRGGALCTARLLSPSTRPAERAVGDRRAVLLQRRHPQSRSRSSGERRYEELITTCNLRAATPSSRMTGLAQENGAIESPHGHLKRALAGPITASSTR